MTNALLAPHDHEFKSSGIKITQRFTKSTSCYVQDYESMDPHVFPLECSAHAQQEVLRGGCLGMRWYL